MLDPSLPLPTTGRTFSARCRVRLADMDERGRLRLDAVARFLQDVAIDDVQETGWGTPEHLWFVRRIRVEVRTPFLEDREVELVTWCSGLAAIAAGRRWTLEGDRGGRIEVDSVWIHSGPTSGPRGSRSLASTRRRRAVDPCRPGWSFRRQTGVRRGCRGRCARRTSISTAT